MSGRKTLDVETKTLIWMPAVLASYGLMTTPGVVVDGQLKVQLKVQGEVPTVDELKDLIG
jgi:hypothetical protein